MPDNDGPGAKLVESAFSLYNKIPISVAFLPKNKKDAAECSSLEIITAIGNRLDIQDVIIMYNKKRMLYGNA
jgi:DNA primase